MDAPSQRPLVVTGPAGLGKTSLLARVAALAETKLPEERIATRFIGATPRSTQGAWLLRSVCEQFRRRVPGELETPTRFEDLWRELPERLGRAARMETIAVLLDGIDEFAAGDPALMWEWLPRSLPAGVALIVSLAELPTPLRRSLPAESIIELPPLSSDELQSMLRLQLQSAGRTLQPFQLEQVLLQAVASGGTPHYMTLAIKQVRSWTSSQADCRLGKSPEEILAQVIERWSDDTQHGKQFVTSCLGTLAAARHGLTEDELLTVMNSDPELITDWRRRSPLSPVVDRLPEILWLRLLAELEPYLVERLADGTTVWRFAHSAILSAVQQLLPAHSQTERHLALAEFFQRQLLEFGNGPAKVPNERKLAELPYQLWRSGQLEALASFLSDLPVARLIRAVHGDLGELTYFWGRIPRSSPCSAYSDAIAQQLAARTDREQLAVDLVSVADALDRLGCREVGVAACRQLLELYRELEDAQALASAFVRYAEACAAAGNTPRQLRELRAHLQELERRFGAESNEVAGYCQALAWNCVVAGSFVEAQQYSHRAVETQRRHEDGPPAVAASLMNHAVILESCGNFTEAQISLRAAIDRLQSMDNVDHSRLVGCLNNLGALVSRHLGDHHQGLEILTRAMELEVDHVPRNDLSIATLWQGIGNVHARLARLHDLEVQQSGSQPARVARDAELESTRRSYQQVLHLRREALGEDHPLISDSFELLGDFSHNTGDFQQAVDDYTQAIQVKRLRVSESHPEVVDLLVNIGINRVMTGDLEGAAEALLQSTRLDRAARPKFPPQVGPLLMLARKQLAAGQNDAALTALQQARAVLVPAWWFRSADVTSTYWQLTVAYFRTRRYGRASAALAGFLVAKATTPTAELVRSRWLRLVKSWRHPNQP